MDVPCLSAFDDVVVDAPPTQGIKYAGSKLKLLPQILTLISKVRPRTVLDGFSGTTRVSQALAQLGYKVISNDRAVWSATFATCYLLNRFPAKHYASIIEHLNNLTPQDGWYTENYGGTGDADSSVGADGLKKPWQVHNTRKLDAIRGEMDRLELSAGERAVVLTSLILALEEVDNTLGHYAAYLNRWSGRSYKTLELKVPALFAHKGIAHEVYQKDIFELLPNAAVDLAYFDPPYGSNNEKMPPSRVRYQAYYHVWTTICLNDTPSLFGKAKRRSDSSDLCDASPFEEFRRGEDGRFIALAAIDRLLGETKAAYILMSYSSGGRATAQELNDVMKKHGTLIDVLEVAYRRNVMADMRWTNDWVRDSEESNREFLYLLRKA
jgi:adenine-specific DNA-methyltransferase